jgi:(E)-4-hydroxy-3-methylbut-2-enyl-diphosphate synthase
MAVLQIGKKIKRRPTRSVQVRDMFIGSEHPFSAQSMAATKTQDIQATLRQVELLREHGADIVRIAIDSKRDVEALAEIRKKTTARLVVDIQESYRLVEQVAPFVDKIRYNPGHLHHHEKEIPVHEKVATIVNAARKHDLAVRIGVNFGSLDPQQKEVALSGIDAALASAREHIGYMNDLGFSNFVVSLKSSDPNDVIDCNTKFAEEFSDVPLHLGVTEAGMLPMGEVKTRIAFESLLARGIGDTLRVSLTLPFEEKYKEILVGKQIIEDVYAGRFRSVPRFEAKGLNLISCPSCSRVENEKFVDLAARVKEVAAFAAEEDITIAVMGCRVNGPGETDDADLGLWCAPNHVNLKREGTLLGAFSYDDILAKVTEELHGIIAEKRTKREAPSA